MKKRTAIRQKIALILTALPIAMAIAGIGGVAHAVCTPNTPCAQPPPSAGGGGGGSTSPGGGGSNACDNTATSDELKTCVQTSPITKDLQLIVNVLSAGVGIVVIGMIILGGIQYSMAGDNPQATAAARQRIANALIALVAYLFIFAFLQWLIPGGLFG